MLLKGCLTEIQGGRAVCVNLHGSAVLQFSLVLARVRKSVDNEFHYPLYSDVLLC